MSCINWAGLLGPNIWLNTILNVSVKVFFYFLGGGMGLTFKLVDFSLNHGAHT